jgi:hypothetical protein
MTCISMEEKEKGTRVEAEIVGRMIEGAITVILSLFMSKVARRGNNRLHILVCPIQ